MNNFEKVLALASQNNYGAQTILEGLAEVPQPVRVFLDSAYSIQEEENGTIRVQGAATPVQANWATYWHMMCQYHDTVNNWMDYRTSLYPMLKTGLAVNLTFPLFQIVLVIREN